MVISDRGSMLGSGTVARKRRSAPAGTGYVCAIAFLALFGNIGISRAELPAEASDTSAAGGLEEIIVTAQKREQSERDVGIAITAVSGAKLEELGIKSLEDFARIEPAFSAEKSLSGSPTYTLRGVGYQDFALAAVPAVAIYTDESPYAFSSMTKGTNMDLQRVEILKGPQGTLFGQSSTGGALNFVAAKPTETLEAGLQGDLASFNETTVDTYVSGPISDTLRGRIALQSDSGGAWQESYTRDASLGAKRFQAARVLLDWLPSKGLTVHLNLSGWVDRSDTQAGQFIGTPKPANAALVPGLLTYPLAPHSDTAADWDANANYRYNQHFLRATLRVDYDVSDAVRLTSLSADSHFTDGSFYGNDGVALENFQQKENGAINSVFQELRLSGTAVNSRVHWLAGGNYSLDRVRDDAEVQMAQAATSFAYVGVGGPLLSDLNNSTRSNISTTAAFVNSEFEFIPRVSLVSGARYTKTDTHFDGCTRDTGDGTLAAGATAFEGFAKTVLGRGSGPVIPIPPGGCVTYDATLTPALFHDILDEQNVSWKGGLEWKPTADTLLFAYVARGFKAGAFTNTFAGSFVTYKPATQERLQDYEAGFKTTWFNRSLLIDGTYFHYDYKNKEVIGSVPEPIIFGTLFGLINIPKSAVDGTELTTQWLPFDGFTLSVAGAWIDSKVIGDFINVDRTGATLNYKGEAFPFSPRWSYNAGANYTRNLNSNLSAYIGGQWSWRSATQSNFGGLGIDRIDAYGLASFQVGLQSPNKSWFAEIWGTNIFNKYYWLDSGYITDTAYRRTGQPAIYGLRLGHKW